jgi:exodeoxyribonuclease-3
MRIATWNVNSIRMRRERLLAWLRRDEPEVVCLQELKVAEEDYPSLDLAALGYQSAVNAQRTYNGVSILSRLPLTDIVLGMGDSAEDTHARFVAATVNGVRVLSVYVPNGGEVDSDKWAYKLAWLQRLRGWLDAHESAAHRVAVCGDFNVAPEAIDVHEPAAWEGTVLYHPQARAALQRVMDFGLVDTFREKHPGEGNKYSWWDYRMLGFPKNRGLRIDHILATRALADHCTASEIDREQRKGKVASDHAPVISTFDV